MDGVGDGKTNEWKAFFPLSFIRTKLREVNPTMRTVWGRKLALLAKKEGKLFVLGIKKIDKREQVCAHD